MVDTDVVVVGAGLAGLRCGWRLAEAGRSVVVVEAAPAVGGRERTDEVDGFLLDRGFQVLNPAYPAVRRWVDLDALELRPFGAGVLVRRERGLTELSHPLRHPSGLLATVRSGLLTPRGVAALVRWAGPVLAAPRRVVDGPDRPLSEGLDRVGLVGPLRVEVLEPFLAGVLADDRGETSQAFTKLLARMFALGVPGVPARGIRALPEQLAAAAVRAGADLRLGEAVVEVSEGASRAASGAASRAASGAASRAAGGAASGATVRLAGGEHLSARAAVVSVGPEAVGGLLDVPSPRTRGLQTWWFAAGERPTASTMLAVDGRRRGPVVNTAVMTNAAPELAPPGRHLVQATCLLPASAEAAPTEAEVRRQVGEIYGVDTTRWELVHRHDIRHALPAQAPPLRTTSPARVSPSVYVCGDHRDTASIQGALASGHRVAGAVLADLVSA